MIWNDKIADIYAMINASSVYNTNRSTTPASLGLIILNQAKDWLCMYKPWRDLRVKTQIVMDSTRRITLPSDCGLVMSVFTDPAGIGKPMWWYTLYDNDVGKRYEEEVTQDAVTGVFTRKLVWPPTVYIPATPYIIYSKILSDYTASDVAAGSTKISFYPMTLMLSVAKKMLQDMYGVAANQDPNWINNRQFEELRMFEAYAYDNNMALDMSVKDRFGNPVYIPGMSLNGTQPRLSRPSPFLPSTFFSGGTA
jgi:hypothetical protein